MSNKEKLKYYLLVKEYKDGRAGYLKNELSNGKVIMLSGKWGSGKTHFWQKDISPDLRDCLKKEQKVYSYISLYGKSSIMEIENDIYGQVYYDAIGGENLVTKTASTFTKLTKRYGNFSSLFDFSKIAEAGEEGQKDNMQRTALSRLENGGVICFDDFERKSKDIDLNDLFGFITQLTINFKCKVVIILNDDVFEGEEKDIFSNVKEKTVSKYLKYEPSIEELFNFIFDNNYEALKDYSYVILKTFEEAEILNARIYMQVLDNLLEWIDNNETVKTDKVIRCLILVNILFETNHCVFSYDDLNTDIPKVFRTDLFTLDFLKKLGTHISNPATIEEENNEVLFNLDNLKNMLKEEDKNIVINNKRLISNFWNYHVKLNFRNDIDNTQLEKINNFIETGILED